MFDDAMPAFRAGSRRHGAARARSITTFAGVVALCAVLALVTCGAASAATVGSWTSHTGPDYELYMAESNEVGAYELVQLINYDIHDITLELWKLNGSKVMSQTVAPHSSAYVELQYGTVDCRIDIISSYYGLEGSYTRVHKYEQLPPPDDGGWTVTPPKEKDPNLIYSQDAVDAMLAWMTFENVSIAALIMIAGAMFGAAVKRATRFLKPVDIVSMAFMAVLASDYMLRYLGDFDRIWYAPLLIGYAVGFLLHHVDYVLPIKTDCRERTIDVRPVVIYQQGDRSGWCIQEQNNKALLKRWMGIPHRLGTDTGLTQEWMGQFKGARGRRIRGRVIWVQKASVKREPMQLGPIRCERLTTLYTLSHASGVEKVQWLNNAKWYFRLQDKYDRLALKYSDLLLGSRAEASEVGATMAEHSVAVNPTHRLARFFSARDRPLDLDAVEGLTEIEEVNADVDEEETEENETEEMEA